MPNPHVVATEYGKIFRHGLTPQQAAILDLAGKDNLLRMTDISKILGVSNSAVTGFINKMEDLNLAKRHTARFDRRVTFINATEYGKIRIQAINNSLENLSIKKRNA